MGRNEEKVKMRTKEKEENLEKKNCIYKKQNLGTKES